MYTNYIEAMGQQTGALALSMQDFENTFAPIPPPPDDTWVQVLLDLVGLGAVFVAGPFIKGCTCYDGSPPLPPPLLFSGLTNPDTIRKVLSKLDSYGIKGKEGLKDATYAVIAATVSIGKDLVNHDTAYEPPSPPVPPSPCGS